MSTDQQGQDGTPFMSYYDRVHALSFVWDGVSDHCDVSWGGYGEPVIAQIPMHVWADTPDTGLLLRRFALTCEEFINQIHVIEKGHA